jgi:hypothetical protein
MLPLLFNQVYHTLTAIVLDIKVSKFLSVCLDQAAFSLRFHFNYKNVVAIQPGTADLRR